jgi:3-hydroxybutyryl-CoA dehydratase
MSGEQEGSMRLLAVGEVFSWERTFTVEDVQAFTRVSSDEGVHHTQPGADGRLLVHGLLVATLPTKIGGSFNLLARDMTFTFLRPVFTGERIRCEVEVAETEPKEGRIRVAFAFVCRNERGEEVLTGTCRGVIRTA